MNFSPASIVALALLIAAVSIVALTVGFVRPRPESPRADRPAAEQGVRGEQRERRQPSERRGSPRRAAPPEVVAAVKPEPTVAAAEPAEPASPTAAAAPRETAVAPPAPEPATVVTAYYRALDAERFDDAWAILTPSVRASFGDLADWRAGYATTLSNQPRDIEVVREGATATIAHELVTEDRSSCGPVRRRFAVRWRLVLAEDGWRAASLSAVKRAGLEPAEACAARHDAAGGAGGR